MTYLLAWLLLVLASAIVLYRQPKRSVRALREMVISSLVVGSSV